jgi:hypothetical protein
MRASNKKHSLNKLASILEAELVVILAILVILGMVLGYALAAASIKSDGEQPSLDKSRTAPLTFDGDGSDLLF